MWYVYALKSGGQNVIYVGSTKDLKRRLIEHNRGLNRSTAPYRPWSLESYLAVKTERQARDLEKYFKTGSGRTILKKRILNDEDLAEYEIRSEA